LNGRLDGEPTYSLISHLLVHKRRLSHTTKDLSPC
jgi:hypothetical protein